MNNELCDGLVDYLNGTLSIEETREFEEHLKTCEDCREIVDATGQLPYLSDQEEPPAGMKSRILANVFEEEEEPVPVVSAVEPGKTDIEMGRAPANPELTVTPVTDRKRKRVWWTPLIAAALLVSLLGNAYTFMQLQNEQPAPAEPQTAFQSIDLQPSEGFGGGATAAVIEQADGALNLVVTAEQLAALEGEQIYQVWLIEGDNPIPAGAFTANANGEGAALFNIENNTEEWDTIAITLEPQPGNESPQGQVVLSAGL
ncbi:anti-sigma factor [Planococcus beigongshangi]|uniref:anti-sigma factor n=1 Tax=Planococcus beigongshangi TaxID=2782536 RepID=UPI00193AE6CC|nr:anti-sigma factor [Planococcus beigongshangi]